MEREKSNAEKKPAGVEREKSALKSEREKSSLDKRPAAEREKSSLTKHEAEGGNQKAEEMFRKILDKNEDGKVTESDFIEVMNKLHLGFVGEHIAKKMFKKVSIRNF
jgi:hypothetical protein